MSISTANNPRHWSRGRFTQIRPPQFDVKEALYPRHEWGTIASSLVPPVDDFQGTVELIRDPSGLVIVGICQFCGGRSESLLDGTKFSSFTNAGQLADARIEAKTQTEHAGDVVLEWATAHATCKIERLEYLKPPVVTQFVAEVLKHAEEALIAGDPVPGHLFVLDDTGRAFAGPIHDIEESSRYDRGRTNELADRKAMLRRMIRDGEHEIVAVVTVSELCPSQDADRSEGLVISYVTSSHSRIGMSRIKRNHGVVNEGPGSIDNLSWQNNCSPSSILDGLFATRTLSARR